MLKNNTKSTPSLLLLQLFSLVTLLMFSHVSSAERWYHVELIVFEQLDSVSDELAPIATVPKASFTPDSNNELIRPTANTTLNDSAAKLANSRRYKVRYHQSWQQPIKTKSKAKSVSINNAIINGRIRLYKGTYLYAAVDLQLDRAINTHAWNDESGIRKPYLQETRRVRSGKLQFFDHPHLGALLKLTPL